MRSAYGSVDSAAEEELRAAEAPKLKPVASTRLLAAFRPLAPIVWAAVLVGDSHKINVVFPHAIDDAVRKPGNDPLAKAASKRCARLGTGANALCGLLDWGKKPESESLKPRFIELYRLAHFRPSVRVEYCLPHDRSFARS